MQCGNHPAVEARWQCTQCPARWCGDCPRKVGLTHHVVCATCGAALATYAPQRTVDDVIARSLRRALSREGLLTALSLGLFYGLLSWIYAIPIIYLGTLVGYYFITVHHVGAGGAGLPTPGETLETWSELRMVAFGGLFCVALGLAPLIVFVSTTHEPVPPRLLLALVLAGQIYMPAVVLSIAVTNSPWAAIWPPTWIRVIARAPGPYVRFVGMWIVSVAIAIAIILASATLGESNWIVDSIVAFVWTLFWLFQASIVGEYIRSNAEAFGWD